MQESERKEKSDNHFQVNSQSFKRISSNIINFLLALKGLLRFHKPFAPGRILVITIIGIALAEVIAMFVVYSFRDKWPYLLQVLVDASLMTIIIYPILYFLSFKPLFLQIQQRRQSESILQSRLRLMQFADAHTLNELLQFTLDEIEALTGSTIGFFHFLDPDLKTLWLQAWSTNTLQNMCNAEGKDSHYAVDQAGVWADAVRQRQPIVHNNYAALQHRQGTPEGHALIIREMVIPIMRDLKVMAILGLGNKPNNYTDSDVEIVTTFADFAWDIVENKRGVNALRQSEERFRTFVDWTYDWESWEDPRGHLVYSSPSCERITGYSSEEFIVDPNLLARIVHPDERRLYKEHHKKIHDSSADSIKIEYRIISRDGSEHWIEHVCRPLFSPDNLYLGRRISNRDITEGKHSEQKIIEQNKKELILNQTIQTIQTDIARDLHDTLGQNISYLRMNLTHLSDVQWKDPAYINNQIQSMTKTANESYELVREMLAILQTGNLADPLSLFNRYAEQIANRSSFQIKITNRGKTNQLSRHQIRELFFIFREALSNIEKYANADQVLGEFIWKDNALDFVLSDNGSGFDPDDIRPNGHYGLKIMRERAELLNGCFSIQSAVGQGTKITVSVPYEY